MKKYNMTWINEKGEFISIEDGESNDLRRTLFNQVCKFIFLYPNIFKVKHDRIMDNIKRGGNESREHWFAILGDQAISILEC